MIKEKIRLLNQKQQNGINMVDSEIEFQILQQSQHKYKQSQQSQYKQKITQQQQQQFPPKNQQYQFTQQKQILSQPSRNHTQQQYQPLQITEQNVLHILQTYYKNNKNIMKRKQLICLENQLKIKLLMKYGLGNADSMMAGKIVLQQRQKLNYDYCNVQMLKQKRTQKRGINQSKNIKKTKKQHYSFSDKQLCHRKLQKILLSKHITTQFSLSLAHKIVLRIQKYCQNLCKLYSSIQFKQAFMRITYQLIQHLPHYNQQQSEQYQKDIINSVDIELNQHCCKIDENSRGTHVEEGVV